MMNLLKRILGVVWIALGPLAFFLLIRAGMADMARNPDTDTKIQWGIFFIVFFPISVGLVLFGYYSLKGGYDAGGGLGGADGNSDAGKA